MADRRRLTIRSRSAAAIALAAAGVVVAGCSAGSAYRSNPTPELSTLSHTPDEVANRTTVTFDTNFSAIWEDAARFMMVDRPSLLMRPRTPY